MTGAVSIRRASADDLDVLAPLFDAYRRFYGEPADLPLARAFLGERLARDESIVFLAQTDGVAVGFTQLYPSFSSTRAQRIFVLNDLFVSADGRRQGVARALLASAAAFGRQEGAARLTLTTAIDNATAQAAYTAAGWSRDESFYTYTLNLAD